MRPPHPLYTRPPTHDRSPGAAQETAASTSPSAVSPYRRAPYGPEPISHEGSPRAAPQPRPGHRGARFPYCRIPLPARPDMGPATPPGGTNDNAGKTHDWGTITLQ